ncbi:MAG: hypothetical protein HQK53_11530 [Oligoflexia bacterium]|nr:hypothetical protein [Oligoflexia bacterium]
MMPSILLIYANCFTAETLVQTTNGSKQIADLERGEMVYSCNLENDVCRAMPITGIFLRKVDHLVDVEVGIINADGSSLVRKIRTTENHQFYSVEKKWIEAGKLSVGEELKGKSPDSTLTVISKAIESGAEGGYDVYDIEVENDHNFYITTEGILVHHCNPGNAFSLFCVLEKYSRSVINRVYSKLPTDVRDYMYKFAEQAPTEVLMLLVSEGIGNASLLKGFSSRIFWSAKRLGLGETRTGVEWYTRLVKNAGSIDNAEAIYSSAKELGVGSNIGELTPFKPTIMDHEHIETELSRRGWTMSQIGETVNRPHRTFEARDTRMPKGGGPRLNDPATGYMNQDGSYVVRNNNTGDVVQINNKNDPGWLYPNWHPFHGRVHF